MLKFFKFFKFFKFLKFLKFNVYLLFLLFLFPTGSLSALPLETLEEAEEVTTGNSNTSENALEKSRMDALSDATYEKIKKELEIASLIVKLYSDLLKIGLPLPPEILHSALQSYINALLPKLEADIARRRKADGMPEGNETSQSEPVEPPVVVVSPPTPTPPPVTTPQPVQPNPGNIDPNKAWGQGSALFQTLTGIADAECGTVDYSKPASERGWEHLQDIFKATVGVRPSDSDAKNNVQPKLGGKKGISWCGLWTTYAWQKAGINVKWKWGVGLQGDVEKKFPYNFKNSDEFRRQIQVGDIIVGPGNLWHHSLVTAIDGDQITTVSGNTLYGRIVKRTKAETITAFYRPKSVQGK